MFNATHINYLDYSEYKLTASHVSQENANLIDISDDSDANLMDWNTELGPRRDALEIVIPVTIIYCIIFLTGIIGNVSTCIVIKKHRSMHTATNYYLFSLAISDFVLLLSGVPQEVYFIWSKYPYIFGEYFCIGRGLVAETSANATVLTITAFSAERYVAICHPFLGQAMSKLSRAIRIIIFIWIFSILSAIPQAIQFGIRTFHGFEKCVVVRHILRHSFQLSTIIFFFVPMCIIVVLYLLIGLHLCRSDVIRIASSRNDSVILRSNSVLRRDRLPSKQSESNLFHRTGSDIGAMRNRLNQFGTRRVLKMLVAVVICFFLCWAPFHAQRLIAVYGSSIVTLNNNKNDSNSSYDESFLEDNVNLQERDHHEWIYTILTYISGILYYLSTCINPFLYNLMSNKYRQAFKIVLFGKKATHRQRILNSQQHISGHRKTLQVAGPQKQSSSTELPARISLLQTVINERQFSATGTP